MPFTEDLSVFFREADFADVAHIKRKKVNGILGKHHVTIHDVETSAPTLTCSAIDVKTVKHGEMLKIKNIPYRIIGMHPDGTGIVVLILEQQP